MPREPATHVLLVLIGAALTPVATGVSLQLLPFVGPLLIYGVVALFFCRHRPAISWKAGPWLTAGLLGLTLLVVLGLLVIEAVKGGLRSEYFSGISGFVRVTLLFTGLPALVGGCLGGWAGAAVARRQLERSQDQPPSSS